MPALEVLVLLFCREPMVLHITWMGLLILIQDYLIMEEPWLTAQDIVMRALIVEMEGNAGNKRNNRFPLRQAPQIQKG